MLSQDYIMRQIQQFFQVLNTILTQVIKLKQEQGQAEAMTYTNEVLVEEFEFNLDELAIIIKEQGISALKNETSFNNDHLEILGDIFYEIADIGFEDPEKHQQSLSYFEHSLMLFEFIEYDDKTYSIDRNLKITKIKSYLN
jgi:hypothetical protein